MRVQAYAKALAKIPEQMAAVTAQAETIKDLARSYR